MNTTADKVFAALSADTWMSVGEIAEAAGLGYSTVGKVLPKLAETGAADAQRVEGERGMRYRRHYEPQVDVEPAGHDGWDENMPAAVAAEIDAKIADGFYNDAAESPAGVPETADPDDARAVPAAPADGSLAAVAGWMHDVRPVSAPPAGEAPRARRTAAPVEVRNWARGELRDAVLEHLRGLPQGTAETPTQIARAIKAYVGPVATNCRRQAITGALIQLDGAPVRYQAA